MQRCPVSLYAALPREAEVIVAELTCHAAVNISGLYERKLGVLKACLFPDRWSVKWLYGFAGLVAQYVCTFGRSLSMALTSPMPFNMILSNLLISYSHDSKWMLAIVVIDTVEL